LWPLTALLLSLAGIAKARGALGLKAAVFESDWTMGKSGFGVASERNGQNAS
jgi:hypothetical protein